jgi:hypothetical protein
LRAQSRSWRLWRLWVFRGWWAYDKEFATFRLYSGNYC